MRHRRSTICLALLAVAVTASFVVIPTHFAHGGRSITSLLINPITAFTTPGPLLAQAGNQLAGIIPDLANVLDFIAGIPFAVFFTVISLAIEVLGLVVAAFLLLSGVFLDTVLLVQNFATSPIVQTGWSFMRDTLNVFFILFLLVIAFATIAGIESYGMRKVLPRLIAAALLVNFSLAIGGLFINFSRVAMDELMRRVTGTTLATGLAVKLVEKSLTHRFNNAAGAFKIVKNLFTESGTKKIPSPKQLMDTIKLTTNTGMLASSLIQLLLNTVAAVVFGAIALLFMVRVVALYILLILSPVAYVFSALPNTAGYARKWWETFLKYVIFGPVAVFFLALATQIASEAPDAPANMRALSAQLGINKTIEGTELGKLLLANVATADTQFGLIFVFFFVIVFLVFALIAAQQLSVFGATAVIKGAQTTGLFLPKLAWATTGAPVVAGLKEAQADIAKRRAAGWRGRLGAFLGAPLQSAETRRRMARRGEDEAVKSYKLQNLGLEETNAGIAAGGTAAVGYARYAVESKLHEEMNVEQLSASLKALADAGRTASSEFFTLANRLKEKAPMAGQELVASLTKQRVYMDDVQKTLGKLTKGQAYAAVKNDKKLAGLLRDGHIRLPQNVVQGAAEGGSDTEVGSLWNVPEKTPGAVKELTKSQKPPVLPGTPGGLI